MSDSNLILFIRKLFECLIRAEIFSTGIKKTPGFTCHDSFMVFYFVVRLPAYKFVEVNILIKFIYYRATQIGLLRFEQVIKTSNRPSQSRVEPFTHLPTSLPHISDVDDDPEIEDAEEPNIIKVRVAGIDWPKGMANETRLPDATGRLVRLPIPETLPNPNSMHIFVQFQVSTYSFRLILSLNP